LEKCEEAGGEIEVEMRMPLVMHSNELLDKVSIFLQCFLNEKEKQRHQIEFQLNTGTG